MVLVSPPLMLATTAAEKITFSNKKFFIGTHEVRRFIVCGVVTDEHTRFIKLCDFYGEIGFYKSASLILPSKNIRCQLRLFLRSESQLFTVNHLHPQLFMIILCQL